MKKRSPILGTQCWLFPIKEMLYIHDSAVKIPLLSFHVKISRWPFHRFQNNKHNNTWPPNRRILSSCEDGANNDWNVWRGLNTIPWLTILWIIPPPNWKHLTPPLFLYATAKHAEYNKAKHHQDKEYFVMNMFYAVLS